MKTNNKIDKSILCKSCPTPIHKECLGMRLTEIYDIKTSKIENHWECQTCMTDKFPIALIENKVFVQNDFNSIFFFKCKMSCKY